MPIDHSICFGSWYFGCDSMEAVGPNIASEEMVKFLFHLVQNEPLWFDVWWKCSVYVIFKGKGNFHGLFFILVIQNLNIWKSFSWDVLIKSIQINILLSLKSLL